MTHQPAKSFSISILSPFNRAGGRTSNVVQKEDHLVTPDLQTFVERYRDSSFPFSDELLRGIRESAFSSIVRYPTTQPCREIAQVYRERALMNDPESAYAVSDLHSEFTLIADALGEFPDEPCRLWTFRGVSVCFSVFEIETSHRVGACLRRDTIPNPSPRRNEEAQQAAS